MRIQPRNLIRSMRAFYFLGMVAVRIFPLIEPVGIVAVKELCIYPAKIGFPKLCVSFPVEYGTWDNQVLSVKYFRPFAALPALNFPGHRLLWTSTDPGRATPENAPKTSFGIPALG